MQNSFSRKYENWNYHLGRMRDATAGCWINIAPLCKVWGHDQRDGYMNMHVIRNFVLIYKMVRTINRGSRVINIEYTDECTNEWFSVAFFQRLQPCVVIAAVGVYYLFLRHVCAAVNHWVKSNYTLFRVFIYLFASCSSSGLHACRAACLWSTEG